MFTRSTYTRTVSGSGTLNPPTGAVAMRVAVVGGGGGGRLTVLGSQCGGGGGGGCAASKIVIAGSVSYAIGSGGSGSAGGNTTASFGEYSLVGGGGGFPASGVGGAGGTGSGGDYNYTGGAGGFASFPASIGYAAGGGAAGPSGAGGAGATRSGNLLVVGSAGQITTTGWGTGGGGGGNVSPYLILGGSGSGMTAQSFSSINIGAVFSGPSPATMWGLPGNVAYQYISPDNINIYLYEGGEMGGGGSACDLSNNSDGSGTSVGGVGGMVVEWFYLD